MYIAAQCLLQLHNICTDRLRAGITYRPFAHTSLTDLLHIVWTQLCQAKCRTPAMWTIIAGATSGTALRQLTTLSLANPYMLLCHIFKLEQSYQALKSELELSQTGARHAQL